MKNRGGDGMGCRHEWKVLSEKTMGGLDGVSKVQSDGCLGQCLLESLAKTTHVVVVSCGKCGKLKRFVTVHEV